MSAAQTEAWNALLDLGERFETGWAVVGGQMVFLHSIERGVTIARPTSDGDTALDIRARPHMLYEFTSALADLGFEPDEPTWTNRHYRWRRGAAVVDVLIPRHLGERAEARLSAAGYRGLEAPGAQHAVARAERVQVKVGDRAGHVLRPSLPGAISTKAAALLLIDDPYSARHIEDIAILAHGLSRGDHFTDYTRTELRRVRNALGRVAREPALVAHIDDAEFALRRLALALDVAERRQRGGL